MLKRSLMLLCFIVIGACESDDGGQSLENVIVELNSTVVSGNWQVSSFIDSGTDETYHFDGYTFYFSQNGNLSAINGDSSISGTWAITSDDDSADDNPGTTYDDIDFVIYFASPEAFEDLSDDWDVLTYSSNTIELIDISGGNGGTDYLTLTKI
ncbi:hypothetical protein [Neptunitalea lumnitzerae]|uniref:Lipocalin-like domain-containing protein n=1 Tax=Neptunitalea lumnitzerae TaxID=2965509 RepID=A0ABQ5MHI9_9FLAO|nr:hypothetical protein [Neptunitalea sp. Y10]GLB48874.1 hypothetical protein Y10_12420 [Neptunitalea sp. Y10]